MVPSPQAPATAPQRNWPRRQVRHACHDDRQRILATVPVALPDDELVYLSGAELLGSNLAVTGTGCAPWLPPRSFDGFKLAPLKQSEGVLVQCLFCGPVWFIPAVDRFDAETRALLERRSIVIGVDLHPEEFATLAEAGTARPWARVSDGTPSAQHSEQPRRP